MREIVLQTINLKRLEWLTPSPPPRQNDRHSCRECDAVTNQMNSQLLKWGPIRTGEVVLAVTNISTAESRRIQGILTFVYISTSMQIRTFG
jgi:hypothetical protein